MRGFHVALTDLPDVPDLDDKKFRSRRAPHPDDVFVIVKEHILSTTMRQQPILCQLAENVNDYPLLTNRSWELL